MRVKKITGTYSSIKIEFDDKIAQFEGELLVNGFLAYVDSLVVINESKVILKISNEEISILIKESVIYSNKNKFKLVFQ